MNLARTPGLFPGVQLLDLVERNTKCEAAFTFRLEILKRSSVRRSRGAQNGNSPFADRTCIANARDLVLQRNLLWIAINYRLPGGKSIDKTIYLTNFYHRSKGIQIVINSAKCSRLPSRWKENPKMTCRAHMRPSHISFQLFGSRRASRHPTKCGLLHQLRSKFRGSHQRTL